MNLLHKFTETIAELTVLSIIALLFVGYSLTIHPYEQWTGR